MLPDEKVCQSHCNSDGLRITAQLASLWARQANKHTHTHTFHGEIIPNSGVWGHLVAS